MQFSRVPFQVTNQITKEKNILELRINFSKDAYTTTIYLSEMDFIKTPQNFLRNSGKSRWRITLRKKTWRMIRKCIPQNYHSRKCYLYLNETLEIALYEGENLLNKKTKLVFKCHYQNEFILLRHDSKGWNDVISKETIML